jgi:hypothetical protein
MYFKLKYLTQDYLAYLQISRRLPFEGRWSELVKVLLLKSHFAAIESIRNFKESVGHNIASVLKHSVSGLPKTITYRGIDYRGMKTATNRYIENRVLR